MVNSNIAENSWQGKIAGAAFTAKSSHFTTCSELVSAPVIIIDLSYRNC